MQFAPILPYAVPDRAIGPLAPRIGYIPLASKVSMLDNDRPSRSLRLHWMLVIASILVPAGLFAGAVVKDRVQVLREGEATTKRTVSIMHEHARKVIETGELALARVDDRIRGLDWDTIATPEVSGLLAQIKQPLEQVVSIWVTDASGTVRAGSQDAGLNASIAERDFFQAHVERDVGTFVSQAFRGRATNTASFAISRRRSTPDGRFDGTVHIALSPEYFARFYADAAPDLLHAAALIRLDGTVLAREPYREINAPLSPDSPLMQRLAAGEAQGLILGKSSLDGIERIYAFRRVEGYPVLVGFGVEKAVLLRQWRDNVMLFGLAASAASLMLLLLSGLALRGLKARSAAMARLHAALEELRQEIAHREAAEQRVRQGQKMEAVGQLTSGIAHDFNNLLAVVLNSLEMLRKRLPPGDACIQPLLDNAEQGARRGVALTGRLLAFGRAQALKPEAIDPRALIEGMHDLLAGALGRVRLALDVPEDAGRVLADGNQLELALLNLAVNARDAMEGEGCLRVTMREEHVGTPADDGLPPGDYGVLSLQDTGRGMDAATLAQCMEPFFTTKEVGKGTGLGLSMVHGFAAQSGGRFVLRSAPGQGTTAELWLPRADSDREPGTTVARRRHPVAVGDEGFARERTAGPASAWADQGASPG